MFFGPAVARSDRLGESSAESLQRLYSMYQHIAVRPKTCRESDVLIFNVQNSSVRELLEADSNHPTFFAGAPSSP